MLTLWYADTSSSSGAEPALYLPAVTEVAAPHVWPQLHPSSSQLHAVLQLHPAARQHSTLRFRDEPGPSSWQLRDIIQPLLSCPGASCHPLAHAARAPPGRAAQDTHPWALCGCQRRAADIPAEEPAFWWLGRGAGQADECLLLAACSRSAGHCRARDVFGRDWHASNGRQ